MILGMSLEAFTNLHVVLSLIGILTGLIVLFGMIGGSRLDRLTAWFLATTVLTSVTGFLFPFDKLLPSHILGILSLIVVAIAITARYSRRLPGSWRKTYVICAATALYFNMFVLVVQAFRKVPALHGLAPTESEPPFAIAQGLLLVLFLWLGYKAVKGFKEGFGPVRAGVGA